MGWSRIDTAFRDAVIAETRGSATPEQIDLLEADIPRWKRTLEHLVEDSGLRLEEVEATWLATLITSGDKPTDEQKSEFSQHKLRVRRFNVAMRQRLRELDMVPQATERLLRYFVATFDLDGVLDELPEELHETLFQVMDRVGVDRGSLVGGVVDSEAVTV